MTRTLTLLLVPALLALGACTETKQEMLTSAQAGDKGAYVGSGSNFTQAGWTPGDKANWAQSLKLRAQRGQNEYNRTTN